MAQVKGSPRPAEVKKRILQRNVSDLYKGWNYSINGMQPPGNYDGPREGGLPNPKEVKKRLLEIIPEQNKIIAENRFSAVALENRAASYVKLYEVSENLNEQALYAEKALSDLNRVIDLDAARWQAFEQRANLLKIIDFFYYFDAVVSDYLNSIRIIQNISAKKTNAAKDDSSKISDRYMALASLYWNRARAFSQEPKLLAEVLRLQKKYSDYSILADFDTATDYAEKNIIKPEDIQIFVRYLVDKGDAAYKLGKYNTALDVYNNAKDFWNNKSDAYCQAIAYLCNNEKKFWDESFLIRLTKVYVKLEKWETALTYLNQFLNQGSSCPEPFLLRARIYSHLGNPQLAMIDKNTANKLQNSGGSCNSSVEQWK